MKILKHGTQVTRQVVENTPESDPVPGAWYLVGSATSPQAVLAQYVGWGRFIDTDDAPVTLGAHPVLVEHPT